MGDVKLASFCKRLRSASACGFTVEKSKGLTRAIFAVWPRPAATLRFGLFRLLQPLALAQAHAGAAAVFVDELDAARLQGAL